jgi:zinc/manganese transport system substrate-binding protein
LDGRRRPALGILLHIIIRLRLITVIAASLATGALAGCGGGGVSHSGRLQVVAAENFWGSIARQLGGDRADVASIVVDPGADPHSYEPSAGDARALAGATLAIVNGVGYDAWAARLLATDPGAGRAVLDVGRLVGARTGDNPHLWYSPTDVELVIGAITAGLQRLDPRDAAYFQRRRALLETRGFAAYRAELTAIRRRYAGTPIGASESIMVALAQVLGLRLITPAAYMRAISEGTDPNPQDRSTLDAQISSQQIKVWVFNSQNSTPDIQRLTGEARARGIQVTAMTETLSPASASFEAWQTAQLRALEAALARATGR